MADEIGEVKELRLALVCYGGVSLAIYMHGIAKELQALVVASTAYETGQLTNPFDVGRSEHAWWNVLDQRARATGVRTRVVVDIVSGTSAGGINGICLAKALSCNLSQDSLTDVWLRKGDIGLLLSGPKWLPVKVRAAMFAAGVMLRPKKSQAPLYGDRMCEWLLDAFGEMDSSQPALPGVETLVPNDQSLDLFVTLTDFRGRQRAIPIDSPRWIRDRAHRQMLEFHHEGDKSQFGKRYSPMLAFAARATSSFPGGFPPIALTEFENTRNHDIDLDPLLPEFFPQYELAGINPRDTLFVDGGVLDNAPFGASIAAIPTKRASMQTDRRLLYIEPDPSLDEMSPEAPAEASWFKTVFASLASIPRREPIVDDLIDIAQRNEDVARIRDVVESGFESVRENVQAITGQIPTSVNDEQIEKWIAFACDRAVDQAGFGYATYARLRIRSVVDGFADEVNTAARYGSDSFQAQFVTEVMRQWATANGLLKQGMRLDDAQMQFMNDFDLAFMGRQLRFTINALNWWYRNDDVAPTRAQLDTGKQLLYSRLKTLDDITSSLIECPSVVEAMKTVFDAGNIYMAVDTQESTIDILTRHTRLFEDVQRELRELIASRLQPLARQIHRDVIELSQNWSTQAREDFLVRYIGFPFWDVLTFPVEALSGVNERDAVQVARLSPRDVSLLSTKGQKLTGVNVHHFGAFFGRKNRENDYLWGRLDAVERMMALLGDDEYVTGLSVADSSDCAQVFESIIDQESSRLTTITPLITDLREQVSKLR